MGQDKVKVMVVDDNHLDLLIAERLLREFGFATDIHAFESGKEALDFLASDENKTAEFPGIIFLDIDMPEMDGFEFLRHFNELPVTIKTAWRIVVLSSSVSPGDRERAYTFSQVIHFITKPMSAEKLEELRQRIG